MNQTLNHFRRSYPVALVGALGLIASLLSSCGSSPKRDPESLKRAQAQAHAARSAYHQDQNARDYASSMTSEPEKAPNEIRYYRVPVEAHVNEEGLLIESHKLTLEIIQP